MLSGECRLAHKTNDIQCTREHIAQVLRLGAVGFAEPGGAFQVSSGLVGVAAFCVTEATDAQFPGGRIDLQIPSQAYVVVFWERGVDDDAIAIGRGVVSVGTSEHGGVLFLYPVIGDEVWRRMGNATFSTKPLAVLAPIVVSVERQAVAMRTEWISLLVIATLQASQRVLVAGVVPDLDRAQGVERVVDKEQDLIIAFTGIANHLCDLEAWEATTKVLEAWDSQQMVIAVGSDKRARKRPEGEEAVVDDVKGLVFVAEMVLASSRGGRIR